MREVKGSIEVCLGSEKEEKGEEGERKERGGQGEMKGVTVSCSSKLSFKAKLHF